MTHSIYIVEDHAVMREMLGDMIEYEPGLRLCGTAASAEDALEEVVAVGPDLVLVDLSLPGMSGTELIEALLARRPQLTLLVLSGHSETVYAEQALAAGATGYVLKGDPAAIREGIGRELRGEGYVSERVRRR